ncbi:MAG TPA: hypothetical protein VFA55_03195, partial [Candidatus Kapabacteria bacterium]|nr:hypothetical protein [Candidatus Kapabacteria bacterium]
MQTSKPAYLNITTILSVWCIVAGVYAAHAQQFQWKSYTTLTDISAVATDLSGKYWAATTGGAFQVDLANGSY